MIPVLADLLQTLAWPLAPVDTAEVAKLVAELVHVAAEAPLTAADQAEWLQAARAVTSFCDAVGAAALLLVALVAVLGQRAGLSVRDLQADTGAALAVISNLIGQSPFPVPRDLALGGDGAAAMSPLPALAEKVLDAVTRAWLRLGLTVLREQHCTQAPLLGSCVALAPHEQWGLTAPDMAVTLPEGWVSRCPLLIPPSPRLRSHVPNPDLTQRGRDWLVVASPAHRCGVPSSAHPLWMHTMDPSCRCAH